MPEQLFIKRLIGGFAGETTPRKPEQGLLGAFRSPRIDPNESECDAIRVIQPGMLRILDGG